MNCRIMTLVSLAVLALTVSSASAHELKIMSFNVCHCSGMDGKVDLERTAKRILSERPDFACLQELDRKTVRTGGVDQPDELARLTGLTATFAEAIPFQGGQYGVAVLSRERPLKVVKVPLPGEEPRILLLCEFDRCVVGTTHLSVAAQAERVESVGLIREAVRTFAGTKPVFLTGDWNATPESAVLSGLGGFLKVLSETRGRTFHGRQACGPGGQPPDLSAFCIDYIAVDAAHAGGFDVKETHVVDDRTTSDHAPVVVSVVPVASAVRSGRTCGQARESR